MREAARQEMQESSMTGENGEISQDGYATQTQGSLALKQFAAERLAEHRNRRAVVQAQEAEAEERARALRANGAGRGAASRVREKVAARYEQSVSYREFLAQESEKALERAQAEAEVAARNARAIADAQRQLLVELEQYRAESAPNPRLVETPAPAIQVVEEPVAKARVEAARVETARAPEPPPPSFFDDSEFFSTPAIESMVPVEPPKLRVQLAGELAPQPPTGVRRVNSGGATAGFAPEEASEQEMETLEAELAFRHSEAFDGHSLELTPIPGNLIEFPRLIVAPRKVRPRLAEGPLRDEEEPESQLRIFEVEPELVSYEVVEEPSSAAEWHGMVLDEPVLRIEDPLADMPMLPADVHIPVPVHPASLERRAMSMVVDGTLVALGFVAFATVFAKIAPHVLTTEKLTTLGAISAGVLLGIFVMYELLFFTLSEATPGMRLARLALCTFTDDNPSRRAMRRRVGTMLVAAAPAGMGVLWMAVDSERLAWHDRMSRMYPREY
ncbi:RDD family protein [Bryocella elongata]|nr:RDD family protein [Bryocella elongata]